MTDCSRTTCPDSFFRGYLFQGVMFTRALMLVIASVLGTCALADTAFEFSRDVAELNFASENLARELRGTLGYGSLRGAAERLSDDAEQLQDSISHGRSHAYVRIQLNDVRRRYQQLQVEVAKALVRNEGVEDNHNALVSSHMENITALYDELDASYYYNTPDSSGDSFYYPYVYTAPVVVLPNGQGGGGVDPGYLPDEVRRWIETGRTLQPRTAAEVRSDRRAISEQTGIEQGFDHRSSVLDRQARQELQEQARNPDGALPD